MPSHVDPSKENNESHSASLDDIITSPASVVAAPPVAAEYPAIRDAGSSQGVYKILALWQCWPTAIAGITVEVLLAPDHFRDSGRTDGALCVPKGDIMKETKVKIWAGLIALSLASIMPAAASPTLTVIHDFVGGNDGDDPNSLILASDGNFYGTTYLGVGTVFKVTPAGQFTTVFTLPPQNPNRYFYGDYFTSVVEGSDGLLYVIARGSNNNPNPMVFRISKSGTGFQVVLQSAPNSLSVASDGNFYGVDGNGIFRLSTSGIYTLLSAAGSGGFVQTSMNKQATDGNFYGLCYPAANGPQHVCRVTTSGAVTPIFQYPTGTNGLSPANGTLTQGSDGFLYGVAVGGTGGTGFQVIFQLSTSGSLTELYQSSGCTPKTGCNNVLPASDGNLWVASPTGDSVYSITTGGVLLQTVSFSSQQNRYAHPQLLVQAPSGILFGTTGEPNPAYSDYGSVFSLNAGLPPR